MRKDLLPLGIVLAVIAGAICLADVTAGLVLGVGFLILWCIVAMSKEHS